MSLCFLDCSYKSVSPSKSSKKIPWEDVPGLICVPCPPAPCGQGNVVPQPVSHSFPYGKSGDLFLEILTRTRKLEGGRHEAQIEGALLDKSINHCPPQRAQVSRSWLLLIWPRDNLDNIFQSGFFPKQLTLHGWGDLGAPWTCRTLAEPPTLLQQKNPFQDVC